MTAIKHCSSCPKILKPYSLGGKTNKNTSYDIYLIYCPYYTMWSIFLLGDAFIIWKLIVKAEFIEPEWFLLGVVLLNPFSKIRLLPFSMFFSFWSCYTTDITDVLLFLQFPQDIKQCRIIDGWSFLPAFFHKMIGYFLHALRSYSTFPNGWGYTGIWHNSFCCRFYICSCASRFYLPRLSGWDQKGTSLFFSLQIIMNIWIQFIKDHQNTYDIDLTELFDQKLIPYPMTSIRSYKRP